MAGYIINDTLPGDRSKNSSLAIAADLSYLFHKGEENL
jgi:hypothetical protein